MVATKSKSSSSSSPSATIKTAHVGKGSKRKKELSSTHNVINAKEEAIASAVLEVAAAAATNNTVVRMDDGSGDDPTTTATATVVPTCLQTKLFSFDEKNNDVGAPATTSEPWYNILTKGDPEYNDYMANEWSFEKVCTLHVNAVSSSNMFHFVSLGYNDTTRVQFLVSHLFFFTVIILLILSLIKARR